MATNLFDIAAEKLFDIAAEKRARAEHVGRCARARHRPLKATFVHSDGDLPRVCEASLSGESFYGYQHSVPGKSFDGYQLEETAGVYADWITRSAVNLPTPVEG